MSSTQCLEPLSALHLGHVAQLLDAALEPRWAERPFGPICTDSRTLQPGQFFLALRGESFDGHRFCATAAQRGAAGLIVDQDYIAPASDGANDLPILRVADTLHAYGNLAAARRQQWGGVALAISGSAGKTTTRRLVADTLKRRHAILEPIKNYNNLIGVPYTLLDLRAEHEIAVMELGMNLPGELRRLTEIVAPNAALLTQISLTHVGMFKSENELVDAKLDLFRGCAPGVPLVVNAGCPRTMRALDQFAASHPIVKFLGEGPAFWDGPADVRIENAVALGSVGYRFDLRLPGQCLKGLELHLFGHHHLQNVAAAAALLYAAGLPPESVAEALDGFRTEPLRGEIVRTPHYTLILDCYNASPSSMKSSLESLAELPAQGRRVLVLADMLELGSHAQPAHEMLLGPLRQLAPAHFFGLGPHCTALAEALRAEGWPAQGFESRPALVEALQADLAPGDQIFLKGSHGFGLEKVAQAIAPELNILPGHHD